MSKVWTPSSNSTSSKIPFLHILMDIARERRLYKEDQLYVSSNAFYTRFKVGAKDTLPSNEIRFNFNNRVKNQLKKFKQASIRLNVSTKDLLFTHFHVEGVSRNELSLIIDESLLATTIESLEESLEEDLAPMMQFLFPSAIIETAQEERA